MTRSNQFTLGTGAATQIVGPGNAGRTVTVENLDATNDAYIGGKGVASTSGVKVVHAAAPIEVPLGDGDDLWAIAAAGTPIVAVVVTGP